MKGIKAPQSGSAAQNTQAIAEQIGGQIFSDCWGYISLGNIQEAADLAGETEPKLVIPGHWDMFEINGEDPSLFADYLDAKYNGRIKCVIPKVMEKIVI